MPSRLLGRHLGLGNATIARAWREYGVPPWRCETFKFSTDPELVAKVTDVVGLYVNPPENAILVDEKSQIQALEQIAPPTPRDPAPRVGEELVRNRHSALGSCRWRCRSGRTVNPSRKLPRFESLTCHQHEGPERVCRSGPFVALRRRVRARDSTRPDAVISSA